MQPRVYTDGPLDLSIRSQGLGGAGRERAPRIPGETPPFSPVPGGSVPLHLRGSLSPPGNVGGKDSELGFKDNKGVTPVTCQGTDTLLHPNHVWSLLRVHGQYLKGRVSRPGPTTLSRQPRGAGRTLTPCRK